MKISIAMATYNGARYLREQLDSFAAQTRLPDELIVSDDGSSDDTVSILEEFARTAPFEVRIFRNDVNLGYAQNFGRAMGLCTGDLIFLSDQDDVWFPEKIEKISRLAEAHPEIMLFMNDAELTDGDGAPLGLTKLGQTLSLGLGESQFTTGCCMALRGPFVKLALPVPAPEFVHDTWLNRLALLLKVKKVFPCVLQYYRRHGDNTSDWLASRTTRQSSIDLARAYKGKDPRPYAVCRLRQLAHLEERIANTPLLRTLELSERVTKVRERIEHERSAVEARLQLLSRARWQRLVPAAAFFFKGQYSYFSGWKSFVKDLLYS